MPSPPRGRLLPLHTNASGPGLLLGAGDRPTSDAEQGTQVLSFWRFFRETLVSLNTDFGGSIVPSKEFSFFHLEAL